MTTYRLRNNKVYARFWTTCGRHERLLTYRDGRAIKPSPDAYVVDGKLKGLAPDTLDEIVQSSIRHSNQLNDEGAFSKLGHLRYKTAMAKYIQWREDVRNDPEFEKHSSASVDKFGDLRLNRISFDDVQTWIEEELAPRYSNNTVKHKVGCGKSLYNRLKKQGQWTGQNPFEYHEWVAAKPGTFIKSTISPEEWPLIQNLTAPRPRIQQAVTIAYYTGLRPSEVYRVQPEDFNHAGLMLTVRVKKTGDYKRVIAIPQVLSTWALNWEWQDSNEKNVQNRLQELRNGHQSLYGWTMESFRRNYISVMELVGCPLEHVDAHQGRYQSSVSKQHYLRDRFRAVNLMRPYMRVFDGEGPTPLRLVK